MAKVPYDIQDLIDDFPTVDLLAHPDSVKGRWEAVLILSDDGDSLFLRKGEALTSLQPSVVDSCKIINTEETEEWLDLAEEEKDLILILRY